MTVYMGILSFDDTYLVALPLQDFSSNGREEKVTTSEVHDLKTSGLKLGNAEDSLEVLVEDIEEAVGESPQEEQGGDQSNWEDELPTSEVTTLNSGGCHWDTTADHCSGC